MDGGAVHGDGDGDLDGGRADGGPSMDGGAVHGDGDGDLDGGLADGGPSTDGGAVPGDGNALTCDDQLYTESFDTDGAGWPAQWTSVGSVAAADVTNGQARFRPTPSTYSLARLYHPLDDVDGGAIDVDVTLTLQFEDLSTQGIGFYVRQNGGYLHQSDPTGLGYAVFVEGFRGFEGIGVWREIDGDEQSMQIDMGLALDDNTPYRVRLRVHQVSATQTRVRARLWAAGQAEPATWNVDVTDDTPALQNLHGGLGADSWSSRTADPITAHTFIDDVQVTRLCNPLADVGAVVAIAETFQFTEGPVWRANGTLLFSDVPANVIYELTPPNTVAPFRDPSANANGLFNDIQGDLLTCEHSGRRVSRTNAAGEVTTVVDAYDGQTFNSPNDLVVRSDGTLYFTDPAYGLANPGEREIAFNGLFRRATDGTVTAEWEGATTAGPNGLALSPDEQTLYMTDSEDDLLLAWDVAPDGALSGQRTILDTGLSSPDGMAVDVGGNLYIATGDTVLILHPDGSDWGAIPLPRSAANCTFGGADGRTLFVTAREGLYSVDLPIRGLNVAGLD